MIAQPASAHDAAQQVEVGRGRVAGDRVELVERPAGVAEPAAGDHRHHAAAGRDDRREQQRDLVADAAGRVLVEHRPVVPRAARCRSRASRRSARRARRRRGRGRRPPSRTRRPGRRTARRRRSRRRGTRSPRRSASPPSRLRRISSWGITRSATKRSISGPSRAAPCLATRSVCSWLSSSPAHALGEVGDGARRRRRAGRRGGRRSPRARCSCRRGRRRACGTRGSRPASRSSGRRPRGRRRRAARCRARRRRACRRARSSGS